MLISYNINPHTKSFSLWTNYNFIYPVSTAFLHIPFSSLSWIHVHSQTLDLQVGLRLPLPMVWSKPAPPATCCVKVIHESESQDFFRFLAGHIVKFQQLYSKMQMKLTHRWIGREQGCTIHATSWWAICTTEYFRLSFDRNGVSSLRGEVRCQPICVGQEILWFSDGHLAKLAFCPVVVS